MTYKGRAVEINGKPLFQTSYSDALTLTVLRKFCPEYRERQTLEHAGEVKLVERLEAARQRLLQYGSKESA